MKPFAPPPGNSGRSPAVDALIRDPTILGAFTRAETAEKQLRLFDFMCRIWLSQTETADDKQAVVDRLQEIADITDLIDKFGQDRIQTAMANATQPQAKDSSAAVIPMSAPRPTPQTTIDAVMYSVRERGLAALDEPATRERLGRCDAAARRQINQRIEKLIAAGRLAGRGKQ
jgi:hypothetical protein